jgi:carbamate kinase
MDGWDGVSERPVAVVAVGGNALARNDEEGTFEQQYRSALAMAESLRWMVVDGWRMVIVHGNGPQVGHLSIQHEATDTVPAQPLSMLGAMTQGFLGSLIGLALEQVCGEAMTGVATVITHAEVDPSDPAFDEPTKPIGPFFSESEAALYRVSRGWAMVEDSGRGYRRVVPSPKPRDFLEAAAISAILDTGSLVIAAGGGGIPVVREDHGWRGVDAVIDKDYSAARLAETIGAKVMVTLTAVGNVSVDFGRPSERIITEMTASQTRAHLAAGQFPPGSMGPKVEAAVQFVEKSGGVAVITSPDLLQRTLDLGPGRKEEPRGTLIVPDDWPLPPPPLPKIE